ncbi:BlaI/MecI/CopY family transcriptional regulator [Acidicapsa ligni]|uniref:BlaI/MecI/CopY family transcriptional regulator n=1 Tax=Acidicapsa ligni TaxID=542300 RepID=UPI0021E0F8CB|nr:BlaI/MecI/CopY family transcriptional regulator [Acidicapsa ligni]
MLKRRRLPKPTEGELELLRVLWDRGSATVRELYDEVNVTRPLGYTSVLKLLQIMAEKGLVTRTQDGRAHIYEAARTQQETTDQLLKDLSQRLFAGSAAQLAMHALAMEPASAEELKEIRALIARREKSK